MYISFVALTRRHIKVGQRKFCTTKCTPTITISCTTISRNFITMASSAYMEAKSSQVSLCVTTTEKVASQKYMSWEKISALCIDLGLHSYNIHKPLTKRRKKR